MPKSLLQRPRDPAQLAKLMIDIASGEVEDRAPAADDSGKNPASGRLGGKKGGAARAAKLSPKKRKKIAQMGAPARWANKAEKYT